MSSTLRVPRTAATCAPQRLSRPTRISAVQVRADWISDGFMRVFTPNKDNTPYVSAEFSGKIRSSRRPFKDNYAAGSRPAKPVPQQQRMVSGASVMGQEAQQPASLAEYLGAALRSVMGNNFTSDEQEPRTGAAGWTGNVRHHRREDRGFHSNKY